MRNSVWIIIAIVTIANVAILGWSMLERRDTPGQRDTEKPTTDGAAGGQGKRPGDGDARPKPTNGDKKDAGSRMTKIDRHAYLSGYKKPEKRRAGVVIDRSPDRFGANLLITAKYPEALLLDMQGNVMHRWSIEYPAAFPEPLSFVPPHVARTRFRRGIVFPNGDLLTMFGGVGLIRLDVRSNVKWRLANTAHHSIDIGGDGKIYTLGMAMIDRVYKFESHEFEGSFRRDTIDVVSMDGKLEKQVSVMYALLNSDFASILEFGRFGKDMLHANSVQWLDGRLADKIPAFKRGNVLISIRNLHTIAVVDLEQQRVVWAMSGMWKFQHEALQLDNGNILVYDNLGAVVSPDPDAIAQPGIGTTRVIEFDPTTQRVVWSYGDKPKDRFLSVVCGIAQRLHTGNTLITSSVDGRAFEVTPAGEIVWAFNSDAKVDGKVATMFEVRRIDARLPALFLPNKPNQQPVSR